MSTTILAVFVQILAIGLPYIGVQVGNEALTTTLQTLLTVGAGLWIWFERVRRGDVNAAGVRK